MTPPASGPEKKTRYVARYGVRRDGAKYPVADIQWPWMGGVGVLVGMPVIRLVLKDVRGSEYLECADLCAAIERTIQYATSRPRWVMLDKESTKLSDHDLHIAVRELCNMQVYAETDGLQAMCDSRELGGRLPLYEHVCLVPALPCRELKVELFHSVVVRQPFRIEDVESLSKLVDKRTSNTSSVLRFMHTGSNAKFDLRAVASLASNWRLTSPVTIGEAWE